MRSAAWFSLQQLIEHVDLNGGSAIARFVVQYWPSTRAGAVCPGEPERARDILRLATNRG